jgi:hypothetical protein
MTANPTDDQPEKSMVPAEQTAKLDGSEADTEQRAEHVLAQLFEAAEIKRIVCVDDVFAADMDSLLELLAELEPEQRAEVLGGDPEAYREDRVWQERAQEQWERLDEPEQASLVDKAYAVAASIEPVSTGAIHALRGVLPPEFAPSGLTLKEWRQDRDRLVSEAEAAPILILFDQSFSREGASDTEGQKLVAELEATLKSTPAADNVFYGLLTNTIAVEQEHERRQQIIQEASLDPKRLVVISKRNLDFEELDRFAARLRSTLLAPTLAGLTDAVVTEVRTQQQRAILRAEAMTPDEMERIVIRASEREGDWPPDTLLRVLAAMQRAKVRERLRVAPEIEKLTQRLQRIAAVISAPGADRAAGMTSTEAPPGVSPVAYPAAAAILHEEFYDDDEHVNSLHLPIELGDLIERRSDGQAWVVLSQPCNLMVRVKGKREPELTHVVLGKLVERPAGRRELFSEFELPYYRPDSERTTVVALSRIAYVRAVIVDACVLNDDGVARLDLRLDPPARLLPHWLTRYKELGKVGKMLFDRTARVKAGTLDANAITGHYKDDLFVPVLVDRESERIEWDCRRIGRVGEPYARALLTRFSQYDARDAYLNDLAR